MISETDEALERKSRFVCWVTKAGDFASLSLFSSHRELLPYSQVASMLSLTQLEQGVPWSHFRFRFRHGLHESVSRFLRLIGILLGSLLKSDMPKFHRLYIVPLLGEGKDVFTGCSCEKEGELVLLVANGDKIQK